MSKRVAYIDNLRWITISLLIVYHAAMAYNTWGEANYIFLGEVRPLAFIVTLISPWFMPVMFLIAGMSSYYSLSKRGYKLFLRERLIRLGIPFVAGVLLLNPVLSYVADVTHNGYTGNYLQHYGVFFTKFTDLSGYDGGFAAGHLWFIITLLVISFVSCAFIRLEELFPEHVRKKLMPAVYLLPVIAVAVMDIRPLGKPLIMYLFVYLTGYCIFSRQETADRLVRYKWVLIPMFIVASVLNSYLFIYSEGYEVLNTICSYLAFALGVPSVIIIGKMYLDHCSRASEFASGISFMFYIIHLPVVVICQYVLSLAGLGIIANFIVSVIICYPVTVLICILFDKVRCAGVFRGAKRHAE